MFDTYSGLIAAYNALHRLLTPRHPPWALSNLTTLFLNCGPHALRTFRLYKIQITNACFLDSFWNRYLISNSSQDINLIHNLRYKPDLFTFRINLTIYYLYLIFICQRTFFLATWRLVFVSLSWVTNINRTGFYSQ